MPNGIASWAEDSKCCHAATSKVRSFVDEGVVKEEKDRVKLSYGLTAAASPLGTRKLFI